MNDTPQHIKDLQLQIWLSKLPGERLRQFLIDNEALFTFWREAKLEQQKNLKKNSSSTTTETPANDLIS